MTHPQSLWRNALSLEHECQLFARQWCTALQCSCEDAQTSCDGLIIQFKLPIAARKARDHTLGHECQYPAHIVGCHEMQRSPQGPRADDFFVSDGSLDAGVIGVGQTKTDRPFCRDIVLSLQCTQPSDHRAGVIERVIRDLLIVETTRKN